MLRETARAGRARPRACDRRAPPEEAEATRREVELADRECLAKGLTTFQDAGSSFAHRRADPRDGRGRRARVRLYVMVDADDEGLRGGSPSTARSGSTTAPHGARDQAHIDGALGSHGAWLLEPYTDLPGEHGAQDRAGRRRRARRRDSLSRTASSSPCTRSATGRTARRSTSTSGRSARGRDAAIAAGASSTRSTCTRGRPALRASSASSPRCRASTARRTRPWVPTRIGERARRGGRLRLAEAPRLGRCDVNGTDAPIEDVDPIANFHASVTSA